ncbi:NAD(P)H-binding protein [Paenibacillus sp. OV219]|uniref:NAD(P)H-binding protein n=1 Tax=Paenibacillus sp. OV219 TaxID=1884377 RepID=UPI0021094BED|nr:NAD(P)H-binding protein [Paenibacillus sp. OV219]
MNFTIFGASGAIGRIVLKHALQNGNRVTAYVRRAGSIDQLHDNLTVIVGELTNPDFSREGS